MSLGETVFIRTLWRPVPVYHDSDGRSHSGGWNARCGEKTAVRHDDGTVSQLGTLLPEAHAARFARPCRRCYEMDES